MATISIARKHTLSHKKAKAAAENIAKDLQKRITGMGLKVRAQIQGDALRVVGAKLDDLQAVQAALKANPPAVPVQFNNYK